jgi:hypothetical protein
MAFNKESRCRVLLWRDFLMILSGILRLVRKNKKHYMKISKERTKWGSVTTYTKINKGLRDKINRRGVLCHNLTLIVITIGL